MLIDNELVGGKNLGIKSHDVEISVHFHKNTDRTSWRGFKLEFPLGPVLEDEGFGMCHEGKALSLYAI